MLRSFEHPWAPSCKPPKTLLTNASLVDVQQAKIVERASIVLEDGRVKQILPSSQAFQREEYARVVDLEGKYVCPGLVDCHVHVTATPGSLQLDALYEKSNSTIVLRASFVLAKMLLRGFTTVRDTGGCDAGIRSAVTEGLIAGPRLVIAGQALSQTGGHADFRQPYHGNAHKCCGDLPGIGRVCDGVPGCLEAARDELRKGADFLKIMCGGGLATLTDPLHMVQFTPEEIRAITTTASYSDTYVTAHAYTNASIRHAVDNGVQAIEHANFIDKETAEYCVGKGVIFTPTMVTYHSWTVPPFNQALSEASRMKLNEILLLGKQSLSVLQKANAVICYGSDLMAGAHDQQNDGLRLHAEVLSPAEVLQSATINGAKLLRMEGQIGVIAPEAYADLLILSKNPLEHTQALYEDSSRLCIMKEGRVAYSKVDGLPVDQLYGSIQDK